MQICFIIIGDETYGVSRLTLSLVRHLRRLHVACSVIALTHGPLVDRLVDAGASVEVYDLHPIPNYQHGMFASVRAAISLLRYSLQAARRLRTSIESLQPEAVITRSPNLVPMTALASRWADVQSYWIMPNAVSDNYPLDVNKRIYDWLFYLTRMKPIANSHYTRSTLRNKLVDATVLHLGVDQLEFDAGASGVIGGADLGLPPDAAVAGIFARLVPEKGQEVVIRALAEKKSELPLLHLLIVGGPLDGSYAKDLQDLTSRLGLEDRVHFLGPRSNVVGLYLACDFIINSRVTPEPFGLSIIEGMMLGRPVLAHGAGGPGETILDGQTGWLVSSPTVSAFSTALQEVYQSRSRWPELGREASVYARRCFDVSVVASKLIQIVEKNQALTRATASGRQ